MLYLRICFDKDGGGSLRGKLVKSHREYIGSHIAKRRDGMQVLQGGPMCLTDDLT